MQAPQPSAAVAAIFAAVRQLQQGHPAGWVSWHVLVRAVKDQPAGTERWEQLKRETQIAKRRRNLHHTIAYLRDFRK